jgi:hypothetical protein
LYLLLVPTSVAVNVPEPEKGVSGSPVTLALPVKLKLKIVEA